MSDQHKVVNTFPSHVEAEAAVLELQKAGFDMNKISIIGQNYQTTEHVRGFLTWKDTAIVSGVDEEINHAQEILKNANHEVNEPVAV